MRRYPSYRPRNQHYSSNNNNKRGGGSSSSSANVYHESADDRNDETFGELNDSNLMREFDFQSSKLLSDLRLKEANINGTITNNKEFYTLDEIEGLIIEQEESTEPVQVATTLEELEASFNNLLEEDDVETIRLLPVLKPQRTLISGSMVSFPEETSNSNSNDIGSTMTSNEQKFIRKLHKYQLTTDDPIKEDFYYLKFNETSNPRDRQLLGDGSIPSSSGHEGHNINFLPARKSRTTNTGGGQLSTSPPSSSSISKGDGNSIASITATSSQQPQQQPQQDNIWKGVLGRASSKSSRKPRQQLSVTATANKPNLMSKTKLSAYTLHLRVLETIENYFTSLLNEESINSSYLFGKSDDPEVALYCFLHVLTIKKGLVCLLRLIPLISDKEELARRIFKNIEYILKELNDDILGLFVKLVQELIADKKVLNQSFHVFFMEKELSMLLWILSTKIGLLISCIIISAKSKQGEDSSICSIYDRLADHLLPDQSDEKDYNKDYYVWQFYALLSINLNVERKRAMVLELRERITSIIEGKDSTEISNLNIFLNALGLDASQL